MYKKIRIQDFINFTSNQDPHENVIQGDVGWVNIDINRSLSYLDKICDFDSNEISEIEKLNVQSNNYSLNIDKNFIGIKDEDFNRETINNSFPLIKGKKVSGERFGNTDAIWIYKIEDEWFLVAISRSNIIPFHKNPYIMANRNSNFEFYKCDQLEGLVNLLKTKLNLNKI